jgi:hypothetical protein
MKTIFLKLKKVFAGIAAALIILLPLFQLAPVAQADTSGVTTGPTPEQAGLQLNSAGTGVTSQNNNSTPSSAPGGTLVNTNDIGCNLNSFTSNTGGTFGICLTNIVYVFTVGIGTGFAYVSAYFFDWAIQLSLNSLAYSQQFVSQGWTMVRDIANMAFLFIILFIAFTIIFQAETNGAVQTLLHVIIIALVINFSFFFTRLVIDAGNIVAIQFYNAIQAPSISATAANSGVSNGSLPNSSTAASFVTNTTSYLGAAGFSNTGSFSFGNAKDLTASIMGMLQLQNLFSTNSFTQFFLPSPANGNQGAGFLVTTIALSFLYIAAAIMFWILTVTFATAGVKFILRVVGLWLVIIVSPLALVAYTMPGTKKYFDQWRSALIHNAFYPAIFMFIFLILTIFANQMGQSNGLINGLFQGLNEATSQGSIVAAIGLAAANVGIRLGLVVAVLWLGLMASKRFETFSGEMGTSFGNWVGGGMLKAFNVPYKRIGPGAWAGGIDRTLQTGRFSMSLFGKELINANNKLTRGIGRFGNSALGYEMRRYGTKPAADTTVPGSHGESYTKMKERQGKEGKEVGQNTRDIDNASNVTRMASIKGKVSDIERRVKSGGPAATAAEQQLIDEHKDLQSKIKNFSKRELESIKGGDIQKIVEKLSESQMKVLKDSEKFSEKDRDEFQKTWDSNSADSPLRKANKQIELLREINQTLKTSTLPMTTTELDTRIGTKAAAHHSVIDGNAVIAMTTAIKANLATVRSQIRAAGAGASTVALQQNLQNLQEAEQKLKTLDDERKKIPRGIGGTSDEGTFDTSKVS